MDLWIALAAAGADYVAKHWKNFEKDNQNSSDFSIGDPKLVTPQSPTNANYHIDKRFPFLRLGQRERLEEENSKDEDGISESSGSFYSVPLIGESSSRYDSKRNRSSLRSRRSKLRMMKPLTSSLYNEYMRNCFHSPTRPLIITDGNRIIGSEGANSLNYKQVRLVENENVFGVTSLAYDLSLEVPGRRNRKARGIGEKISSSVAREEHSDSLAGSENGALLFGLGVSIGLISSLLANKTELDKLNTLLKQTENLVQDLQEELEMKDSLTVKELPNEDFESHDNNHDLPNEDLETMSKIEAELEAELERLEMNMNSSSLERRLSDLAESDPDFVSGISQDELRPDMFGTQIDHKPYANQDGSGSSTPHPSNYAVSAQELTLRLHELIQSRLKQRVKDLETALEASERKAQITEKKESDSESISSQVSINEPVIINLSGEGLDVYNEAYDELKNENDLLDWQISSEDIGVSGSESESDDEFEKLLIKQIVEKNRRNSAAILNVERELFQDKM